MKYTAKQLAFLGYGLFCYLAFFGTFTYATGFIGGFGVPKTLDGPQLYSLTSALPINALLLLVFAMQHSIMARKWFKQSWTRVVPSPIERSTYVLLASLALMLLFWQWRPIAIDVWRLDSSSTLAMILRCIFGFGWVLAFVSTILIDHFDLFGLRQVWLHMMGKPYTARGFVTPGPYQFVRHPLYVGWLLVFWMTPTMTLGHLVFALGATAYILFAIPFEERDLIREFGDKYRDYRHRVPMLVPFTGGSISSAND